MDQSFPSKNKLTALQSNCSMLSWDRQSEWFELCWNNHEYTVALFIEENPEKYPLQYDLKKRMGTFQSLREFCMRLLGINIDSSVISSGEKSKNIKTKSTTITVLCFSTVVLCKHRHWRARISMLKFPTKTILMTFRKHWPVCQPAEIEVHHTQHFKTVESYPQ